MASLLIACLSFAPAGRSYTSQEYKDQADLFADHWLSQHPELKQQMETEMASNLESLKNSGQEITQVTKHEVEQGAWAAVLEKEFWRIVETGQEKVRVEYANGNQATNRIGCLSVIYPQLFSVNEQKQAN